MTALASIHYKLDNYPLDTNWDFRNELFLFDQSCPIFSPKVAKHFLQIAQNQNFGKKVAKTLAGKNSQRNLNWRNSSPKL